jgi:YD repeat-containing protein
MLRAVRSSSPFVDRVVSLLVCLGLIISQLSIAMPLAAARERLYPGTGIARRGSLKPGSGPSSGPVGVRTSGRPNAALEYAANAGVMSSPLPQQSSAAVVVSQIYGGGGNTGATYKNDFIELFNRSNTIVDLTNWSVQYAAPGGSTWQVVALTGSLGPGQYYLVQAAPGASGTTDLPAPDATSNISMNSSAGKVALVSRTVALSGTYPLGDSNIIDFVGYGSTASAFEGSGPTTGPSNTNAVLRANGGCTDTDNNSTDFNSGAPAPRNSSAATSPCGGGIPPSTTVVLSEFRTRGPNGGFDEFIELYNLTDNPIDISGWKIKASNSTGGVTTRVTVNQGTLLPAHGHFLATHSSASGSYSGTVAGDQTYNSGIPDNGGISIVMPDETVVDRVGMSSGSAFKESRSLDPLAGNTEQSYERKPGGGSGSSQDTNDNPSDFLIRATSDPQNLHSAPSSSNNLAPTANIGGPYASEVNTAIQFNGSGSSDPDGIVTGYQWSFGDGAGDTSPTPVHIYPTAGTYSVSLTVTDNNGAQSSASTTVTVNAAAPTPTPTPTPEEIVQSGEELNGRLAPGSRVGMPGEDLLSGNFNWGVPLLQLKGRAGFDLGLSLVYNSLIWTKDPDGQRIVFDGDQGFPAPGFRLGFPVIQGYYEDVIWEGAAPQGQSYTMITPSGERVELKQVGSSNTYESANSTYLRLQRVPNTSKLYLTTTSGTQMKFVRLGDSYKCVQIEDRNGNYLIAEYDAQGRLLTVSDTLARVISFNYEANNLVSITQSWGAQTHVWAKFEYEPLTIQSNFVKADGTPLPSVGTGQTIQALKRLVFADQSSYRFSYNVWGQVYKIARHAADDHLLNYTSYNLPGDSSTPFHDCPRFTEKRVWAQYWNGDQEGAPVQAEEALSRYVIAPGGAAGSVTLPDGLTTYKEYFGTAGWQKGLTTRAETYYGSTVDNSTLKRWVTTDWTQDDESLSYSQNPRPVETNIYDAQGNRKRTRVEYYPTTSFSLPREIFEYDSDAATVLRRTLIGYNLANEYVSRRIIGLVSEQTVYGRVDGQEKLASKVTYEYDESGENLVAQGAPTQHDSNYGSGFMSRGNLCITRRWDTDNPADIAKSIKSEMGYNMTGSLIFYRDALGSSARQSTISYTDSNGGGTLAYPTKTTDPDGYFSTVSYNYDTGSVTESTNPKGGKVLNRYDSIGRLEKRTLNDGSNDVTYTGITYKDSLTEIETSTLLDRVDNVDQVSYSSQRFDGAGRSIGMAVNHPGSQGGYSGQRLTYDVLGRQIGESNPAEINNPSGIAVASWQLAGDDAGAWRWKSQQYDWKGRPTISTNLDGTITEAAYDGCGCAGGETITLKGEQLAEGRRQQKVYKDSSGRAWKTEVFNWDGTVYSTTVQNYGERGQVSSIKQYQGQATVDGACPAGTCQETTFVYDGHGRLKQRHQPSQLDQNNQPLFTTYTYFPDDTVESVTDARGAQATLTYNKRKLVTGITYNAASGIEATPNVSFDYDAAGNRTSMVDGEGASVYNYDALSRMYSESRQLSINNAGRTYALSYEYTRSGQLKSVTDPFDVRVDYNHDSAGRLSSVTGTPYMTGGINGTPQVEISQYATDLKYRAWGSLKSLTYGNQMKLSLDYNDRLQVKTFKVYDVAPPPDAQPDYPTTAMSSEFQYYADGSLRFANDLLDHRFDRAYQYDKTGMLQEAYSGLQARDYIAGTNTVANNTGLNNPSPYRQSYQYDVWGNLTGRDNRFWSREDSFRTTYTNNRRQDPQWQYDAEGNLKSNDTLQLSWDAVGRNRSITDLETGKINTQYVDGDGRVVTRVETENGVTGQPTKYVYSSVIGKIITQLDAQGNKYEGYVYAGGELIAKQMPNWIAWEHENPLTGSRGESQRDGWYSLNTQPDATGVDVGMWDPYIQLYTLPEKEFGGPGIMAFPDLPSGQCTLDGMAFDCADAAHMLEMGTAMLDPANPPSTFGGSGSGIGGGTTIWVPDDTSTGGGSAHQNPDGTWTGDVTINGGSGGQFVWIPTGNMGSQIIERPLIQTDEQKKVGEAKPEADKLLQKSKCAQFVLNTLMAAYSKINSGKPLTADEQKFVTDLASNLIDTIKNATLDYTQAQTYNEIARAEAVFDTQTITLYKGFFSQKVEKTMRVNNEEKFYFTDRTVTQMAQTLIHEALHLSGKGLSDAFLGEVISGKPIKGKTEDERRKKGSDIISDAVAENCK